jgi:undecaprenyl-diphosphatase
MNTRFTETRYYGLHLLAGLLIFIVTTLILSEIAEDVMNGEFTIVDAQLSNWLHVHGSPALTTTLRVATYLGSTILVSSVAGVVGLYLLSKRQFYWLAAIWLSVFGGMGLNKLLKFAFHRPRPHFNDPILRLTGYSFPSGHTMMATVLYGALAAFLIAKVQSWRARLLIILAAGFLIALVGFSRIYLGAHYLSDVLAAIAEGIAWLSLSLTAVYSLWRKSKRSTHSPGRSSNPL